MPPSASQRPILDSVSVSRNSLPTVPPRWITSLARGTEDDAGGEADGVAGGEPGECILGDGVGWEAAVGTADPTGCPCMTGGGVAGGDDATAGEGIGGGTGGGGTAKTSAADEVAGEAEWDCGAMAIEGTFGGGGEKSAGDKPGGVGLAPAGETIS